MIATQLYKNLVSTLVFQVGRVVDFPLISKFTVVKHFVLDCLQNDLRGRMKFPDYLMKGLVGIRIFWVYFF